MRSMELWIAVSKAVKLQPDDVPGDVCVPSQGTPVRG
jgi:hypothetical protein